MYTTLSVTQQLSDSPIIRPFLLVALIALTSMAPSPGYGQRDASLPCKSPRFETLHDDLRTLSSDAFAGRKPATPGHQKAQNYLVNRFKAIGLLPVGKSFVHPFYYDNNNPGYNIIGLLTGSRHPDRYLVVSAHYDHLGQKGSRIFNGADDNASGVAAMLSLAAYFKQHLPHHSLLFLATDAEESGLHGAYAFFRELPVRPSSIFLNINIDMIGHGGHRNTLYLVHDGSHQTLQDWLADVMSQTDTTVIRVKARNARSQQARLTRSRRANWQDASDYAVFGENNVPFLHIGTDTHPQYHTPFDTYENIDTRFFEAAAHIAHCVLLNADRRLRLP